MVASSVVVSALVRPRARPPVGEKPESFPAPALEASPGVVAALRAVSVVLGALVDVVAGVTVVSQLVALVAVAAKSTLRVDADLVAVILVCSTLVDIHTHPTLIPNEPPSAGAVEGPLRVHADLGAATIPVATLVNVSASAIAVSAGFVATPTHAEEPARRVDAVLLATAVALAALVDVHTFAWMSWNFQKAIAMATD